MRSKDFTFNTNTLKADGSFVGFASVYGNLDQGGDVVERGAFTKSMQDRGATVPILWQHDQKKPIGLGTLTDTPTGLTISGKLSLGVSKAKEAYALLNDGAIKGLSIGYDVVKQAFKGGARHLQELKLYEVSLVTFPMNDLALVSDVKSGSELYQAWMRGRQRAQLEGAKRRAIARADQCLRITYQLRSLL